MERRPFKEAGLISLCIDLSAEGGAQDSEEYLAIRTACDDRRKALVNGTHKPAEPHSVILATLVVDEADWGAVKEVFAEPGPGGATVTDRLLVLLHGAGFGETSLVLTRLKQSDTEDRSPVYNIWGERYRELQKAYWGPMYDAHSSPEAKQEHLLETAFMTALLMELSERKTGFPAMKDVVLHSDEMYNLYAGSKGGKRWTLMRPSRQWRNVLAIEAVEDDEGRMHTSTVKLNTERSPLGAIIPVMRVGAMNTLTVNYLETKQSSVQDELAEREIQEQGALCKELDVRMQIQFDRLTSPNHSPFPDNLCITPSILQQRLAVSLETY